MWSEGGFFFLKKKTRLRVLGIWELEEKEKCRGRELKKKEGKGKRVCVGYEVVAAFGGYFVFCIWLGLVDGRGRGGMLRWET